MPSSSENEQHKNIIDVIIDTNIPENLKVGTPTDMQHEGHIR